MWIEIFKAGTHTDSLGREYSYSAADLDEMAGKYNAKVSSSDSYEAPVVKGHPGTNEPAYGWVERLGRRGNILLAKLKGLSPEFVDEVGKGLFKKVSVAIYPDGLLRHVGFLGAAAPAVKGLKSVQFASEIPYKMFDAVAGAMSEPTAEPDEIGLLIEKNKQLQAKLSLIEKENRLKEFRQYAGNLAEQGILLPAQCDPLIDILEMAHQKGISEYAEDKGRGVELVKSFVASFGKSFIPGEIYKKGVPSRSNPESDFEGAYVSDERLILHNRAKEISLNEPGLSYSEAALMAQKELFGTI